MPAVGCGSLRSRPWGRRVGVVRDTRGSGSPGRGPFPSPDWGSGFRGSPGRTGYRGARAGGAGAGLAETKASGTRPCPWGLPCSRRAAPAPRVPRSPTLHPPRPPCGPAPKLGAGMTKYGACARPRAGRKEPKSSLDPHQLLVRDCEGPLRNVAGSRVWM